MADISQELIIIINGRYGRDIRQAIYDALRKVNSGGGGGGGGDLSDYYTKEEIDLKLGDYSTTEVMNQTIGAEQRETLRLVSLSYYTQTYIDENIPTNTAVTQTIGAAEREVERWVELNYYNKTNIDTTLASYYTKTQIDTTLASYYTKSQVDALIGSIDSMPHVVCTQAQYDNMDEHDEDTLYFVKGETSVSLYLGDLPVNTGGGGGSNSLTGSMGLMTSGPTSSVAGSNEEV